MTSNVHAFTSVTTNYLPKARVLAESVKRVDPSVHFHLLLSDDLPEGFTLEDEPFDNVIFAEDLPIQDFKQWVFSHRLVELCTAVKGVALEQLFAEYGADKVFYFDPDIAVFSRLDELIGELDTHSVLLTPHQAEPETTMKGIIDNEMCSLRHGVFNLGFVGVANSEEGRKFSRWWRDRLMHFCRDEPARALFTDQKWVNLAPCLFDEVKVLRSPAFNVATWNLSNRKATGSLNNGIEINGEALGFYHFSGFDSGAQERQLNEYGAHSPVLFELRDWYIEQCAANQQAALGGVPSKYSHYADGKKVPDRHRLLYRIRPDLQKTFPDPFVVDGFENADLKGGYRAWYRAQMGDESNEEGEPVLSVTPNATIQQFLTEVAGYLDGQLHTVKRISRVKKLALRCLASSLRSTARFASRS